MLSRLDRRSILWLAVAAAVCLGPLSNTALPWLVDYPKEWVLPVTPVLDGFMLWFVDTFGFIFKTITLVLEYPIAAVKAVLDPSPKPWLGTELEVPGLPWVVTIAIIVILSHYASGWRLALFSLAGLLYMVVSGFWVESMNTLSLVAISVPLSVGIGFLIGIVGYRSPRAERIILPTLDIMQTVPTFAYLLPIIKLFGFGPVTGLITSLLYAFAPMVRNTILGLKQVQSDVIESGLMSGATKRQLFWQVRVPAAQRQLLLGVNQAIMAALSMVIIASIIGGSNDIGWAVLSTLRKASFGESFLAGIVIAFIAMIMDRVSWGLATREHDPRRAILPFAKRHAHFLTGIGLVVLIVILVQFHAVLQEYPRDWRFYPAKPIDQAIQFFVMEFKGWLEAIKNAAFFFVMFPIKMGLADTVTVKRWGFEWTQFHAIGYALIMGGLSVLFGRCWSFAAGVALAIWSAIYLFGITHIPWPAIIALVTAIAYSTGGRNLAVGAFVGLVYLLVTGIWEYAILSIYLCGIAVFFSFVLGSALGIWAAESDRVSRILRPINDTLQTMPLFVLLIPIVMIFKIGEFTALIAICLYAVVPAQRYAESALRGLPKEVVEAGTSMGCTRTQLLIQVKLPLALPGFMLGLNQTIMYGISMLVITALVGTKELGQQVYVGLSDGDFGVGLIAGIGMTVIAMIADRITQAWSLRRKAELGLA
jgi:glycine betaine/proline transport system permease protein